MFRKLLACLALLTGLTAAGAPVQAEVAIAMTSQIEASVSGETGGPVVSLPALVHPRLARLPAAAATVLVLDRPRHQPTVRLGSDRARE